MQFKLTSDLWANGESTRPLYILEVLEDDGEHVLDYGIYFNEDEWEVSNSAINVPVATGKTLGEVVGAIINAEEFGKKEGD